MHNNWLKHVCVKCRFYLLKYIIKYNIINILNIKYIIKYKVYY